MSDVTLSPPAPGWRAPVAPAEARSLLRQATPIALAALVNMAMSVTDTVMTAGFGPAALAAAAIVSDFYSILFYLLAGIIGGLAPLYAAASASGDAARLRGLRSAGWAVAALLAALAAPLVWTAPDHLTRIGIDPELLELGRGYAQAMALALIPNAAAAVFRCRLTAIERPGLLLRVTLAAVPLNALGNLVLMHGIADWPGLGVTGAGVSSLLVWSFVAAALAWLSRRHGDAGTYRWPDLGRVTEIVRLGLPIGIATLADVGLFLGATLYAGTLSAPEAAAHALSIRAAGVTYTVSVGLMQASTVRIARRAAGGTEADRRESIATALALGAAGGVLVSAGLAAGALAMAVAPAVAGLGPTLALAAPLVALLAAAELVGPAGAAAIGLLRGLRDTRAPMVFALVGNWGVAAPLGLGLSLGAGLGVTGVWIGLAAGSVVASLLTLGRVRAHWPAD